MNKRLKQALSKVSLFWRFFILLSLVTSLFLVTLSVSSRQFSYNLQKAYLEQAEEGFHQNCQSFSRELFLAYSLPPAVENCASYADAAGAASLDETQRFFSFNEVRDSFVRQCALLRLPLLWQFPPVPVPQSHDSAGRAVLQLLPGLRGRSAAQHPV